MSSVRTRYPAQNSQGVHPTWRLRRLALASQQVVLLELGVQRAAADAEQARGQRTVVARARERGPERFELAAAPARLQGQVSRRAAAAVSGDSFPGDPGRTAAARLCR